MRELQIAYGNRRTAVRWSNKTITFGDLCKRLKTPLRSAETVEEYRRMPKAARDDAKDVGGFVPAKLACGRRQRGGVICVSMLKLDADRIDPALLEHPEDFIHHAAVLYSTHSHTPEKPRARILIPLARDVGADEGAAITRYVASGLGIEQFDECSYQMHQDVLAVMPV
jgi:hypothetical protein